jgi:hypothetical protein
MAPEAVLDRAVDDMALRHDRLAGDDGVVGR